MRQFFISLALKIFKVIWNFKPTRWLMEQLFATLIGNIPNSLSAWVYPRVLKPSLQTYIDLGVIDLALVNSIGQDMVAAFSQSTLPTVINDATVADDPVMGFYNIIMEFLTINQIALTGAQAAPLMVKLGNRITNDPDFQITP